MTLRQILVKDLQEIHASETEHARRLPALAADAFSDDLRDALNEHLSETQRQIQRIKEVLERLGEGPEGDGKVPETMHGLQWDLAEKFALGLDPLTRDVLLIAAAQKLEHLEIACYGTARAMAHTLGMLEEAKLLQDSLDEEQAADERLSRISLVLLKEIGQPQAA
jgi:ferritin-like metal-binding protein YciE